MPIYEYQCQPHKHRFELRQGINEPLILVCPECGGPVRRVILPIGIHFKGSGFYATDSRSSENRDSSKAKSSGESSGEASGGTPAEKPAVKPKPETKTESSPS